MLRNTGIISITIPNTVTRIGHNAFNGCTSLTSITIPNSITTMGNYVFGGCTSLTQLPTFPVTLTTLSEGTFNGCTGLTSITIPGHFATIGNAAFAKCSNLTTVTLSEGITTIGGVCYEGSGVFASCSKITQIRLPDTLTTLGTNAFIYCTSLSEVYIPANIGNISVDYANGLRRYPPFYGCTGLRTVNFATGIENIPDNLLRNTGIVSITIPGTITRIGTNAFNGCSSLTTVTYNGSNWNGITINSGNDPLTNAYNNSN